MRGVILPSCGVGSNRLKAKELSAYIKFIHAVLLALSGC